MRGCAADCEFSMRRDMPAGPLRSLDVAGSLRSLERGSNWDVQSCHARGLTVPVGLAGKQLRRAIPGPPQKTFTLMRPRSAHNEIFSDNAHVYPKYLNPADGETFPLCNFRVDPSHTDGETNDSAY